ncbi:pyrimidine-nucleoside phosphorylase [Anaerocolumna cellulosilytica]|uniref:Pyrimidine-nucleoside phosphorylase n=1 Tax=Anaerocolumna cellulosilytica TaxID=433286 RepID=A0A6S6QZV1_9FIRM|nr:pyrimidine-nucleoside phosphorylase [Anaerocolumna cellulosilytica]MBB5197103.1 pyrimidine-nucleoside phosphorylase [Anaerocolumna cellulosilytica]BCJ95316.1 pyrimidine-nucleoside phosphorylase [Anaerocolumna cellulosilytica]
MNMYDLISKKKYGETLTNEEIHFIVDGFTSGAIKDYQMSAFLMAVCLKGMDKDETIALTMAMAHSGDMLDLSAIDGVKVDKHSTGGVGDKTSLVLSPMVAALGIPVAKMSGRGLGHTGGTIDKLESFRGFSTSIPTEKFIENVNKMKMAIVGQTANLAPADKKIYALRDVTATVDNISLIASSIMSKKIASGADVIVLDVKTGSGAFMKTLDDSIALAEAMVEIGNGVGRETYAVITDMNQPLGNAVGNSIEVAEAIQTLQGNGPADLLEVSLTLGSYMLYGAKKAVTVKEAREMLERTIADRTALNKLAEFVRAQGGDDSAVFDTELFPKASIQKEVLADKDGYVTRIITDEIGMTSLVLGGGRETKDSEIDLSVGIRIHKKLGDKVKAGEALATLYGNDAAKVSAAATRYLKAYTLDQQQPEAVKYIYGIVTKDGLTRF